MPVTIFDPLFSVTVKPEAVRVSKPLEVTFADESVISVELFDGLDVVPTGIPIPVTVCPNTG